MSSVTPSMVRTSTNPEGLPIEVFDRLRASLAANRAQFFRDLPAGPFYGFKGGRSHSQPAARGR